MTTPLTEIRVRTTQGFEGVRVGNRIWWEDGQECVILDENFPVLEKGGRVIRRSMHIRDLSTGNEGLLLLDTR